MEDIEPCVQCPSMGHTGKLVWGRKAQLAQGFMFAPAERIKPMDIIWGIIIPVSIALIGYGLTKGLKWLAKRSKTFQKVIELSEKPIGKK